MKYRLFVATLVAFSFPVLAADVGVSFSVGQPGFYGRIDVGDYPPPRVIYRRPMMLEQGAVDRAPIYLRVPPGHAKNWRKHCDRYGACGEQVYFVQDNWYKREYAPRYRERHDARREPMDGRRDDRGNDHRDRAGDHRVRGGDPGARNQGPGRAHGR